jgi:hypothetical protein
MTRLLAQETGTARGATEASRDPCRRADSRERLDERKHLRRFIGIVGQRDHRTECTP